MVNPSCHISLEKNGDIRATPYPVLSLGKRNTFCFCWAGSPNRRLLWASTSSNRPIGTPVHTWESGRSRMELKSSGTMCCDWRKGEKKNKEYNIKKQGTRNKNPILHQREQNKKRYEKKEGIEKLNSIDERNTELTKYLPEEYLLPWQRGISYLDVYVGGWI
ncbi:UvrABC system protein C [Striga asiatica]|uniref:UvrABC system protein C n=1 Tax=Striga asiatica TaxID=4170 RepID=A0A5A7Q6I7_STRAF|nr:UvrABC system protein C [Striga asiatica]